MVDKPNSFHTLGLELNEHLLKGAVISKRGGKAALDHIFEVPCEVAIEDSMELVKPLYTGEFQEALQLNLIVTALDTSSVLVRPLEVPLKKEKEIDQVLAFQAEPVLPYPVDNAILDRQILNTSQEGSSLTLFSARKDHVHGHVKKWQSMNIEPEVVSCTPLALAAFATVFAPTDSPQFILHLGNAETTCLLIKGNIVIAAQSFSQGINSLKEAYKKDAKEAHLESLDFSQVQKSATPSLFQAIESLRLEITRTYYALLKQAKGQEIVQILATGELGAYTNLAAYLLQLNKPVVAPSPQEGFSLPIAKLQSFAIPIGCALTALPDYRDEIDFRQGELAYPNPWKRYKVPLAIYLALCISLSLATFLLGNSYISYQEDNIRQEFSELLKEMHKPYKAFDNEYSAKLEGKKIVEEREETPLKNLDQQDLTTRLNYLEKTLQSTPDLYPLLPNVPGVSDVLAWLSTHPAVAQKDEKTGRLLPLIQIENFHYTVVKRPEMTKKQEKYQVKVELEFSSPTPKLAREFHDALIAPNAFVDPKGEVKWNTNRGLYRASFFLKDKTVYPSS